jgi:spore coat polysaccharide biosynthesis predicted glycosyltransferase SpsG
VAIDDLADRFLDVDLVVNGSPNAPALAYRVAGGCRLLLGPEYALLRPTYQGCPARRAPDEVSRVLVTLGGSDPLGLTEPTVQAVRRALPRAAVDVLLGPLFRPIPGLDALAAASAGQIRLHRGVDDPVALMSQAELAVSAGGQTLYELAATGLPTVALSMASNQEGNLSTLMAVPTLLRASLSTSAGAAEWSAVTEAVRRLAADRDLRQRMSDGGQKLIDGRGATRVATAVLALGRPQRAAAAPR